MKLEAEDIIAIILASGMVISLLLIIILLGFFS